VCSIRLSQRKLLNASFSGYLKLLTSYTEEKKTCNKYVKSLGIELGTSRKVLRELDKKNPTTNKQTNKNNNKNQQQQSKHARKIMK